MTLPIETERLILRPFTHEDVPSMHAIYSDAAVMEHVGSGAVEAIAETESMLQSYIDHQATHGFSFWALVDRRSGALIGDAGLFLLRRSG